VLGRLKRGVTIAPGQRKNLSAISARWQRVSQTDTGLAAATRPSGLGGDTGDVIRGFLYSVAGLALLVLGAACANLASLFAAAGGRSQPGTGLRVALGASRWRVMRQLLTEAMVFVILGGRRGWRSRVC